MYGIFQLAKLKILGKKRDFEASPLRFFGSAVEKLLWQINGIQSTFIHEGVLELPEAFQIVVLLPLQRGQFLR